MMVGIYLRMAHHEHGSCLRASRVGTTSVSLRGSPKLFPTNIWWSPKIKNNYNNFSFATGSTSRPPLADQRPRVIQYPNGRSFTDPFDWMRNPADPELMCLIREENRYLRQQSSAWRVLASEILKDLNERSKRSETSANKAERGVEEIVDGFAYYTETESGLFPLYCRRTLSSGKVEVLLDVNKEASSPHSNVGTVKISPDHKYVAFTIDKAGEEVYDCIVRSIDSKNSKNSSEDICIPNVQAFEWAAEGHLFFTVPDDLHRSATVHFMITTRRSDVCLQVLTDRQSKARVIYHEEDPAFFVDVSVTKDKSPCSLSFPSDSLQNYLTINSNSKRTSEVRLIDARNPRRGSFSVERLRPVWPRKTGVEYFVNHGTGGFYMVTNVGGAENYQLLRSENPFGPRDRWEVLLAPRSDIRIEDLDLFRNFVAVWERDNGRIQTRILRLGNESVRKGDVDCDDERRTSTASHPVVDEHLMRLPSQADSPTVHIEPGINASFDSKKLRFSYSSLIYPGAICDYDMESRTSSIVRTETFHPKFDANDFVCEYHRVSEEKVPLTIAVPKNFQRNSTERFVLQGYGAYGQIADPHFQSDAALLLMRGCGVGIAHVRGGGELGRRWYDSGRVMNKRNGIRDFANCAKYLQELKLVHPNRLAANNKMGMSAGGLLIAAAINEKPQLFSAALLRVPFVDVLTTMMDSSLPLTLHEFDEWGDPNLHAEVFEYISSYDPYRNISNEKDYPAMYLTAALSDPRVPYWHALKYASALRRTKLHQQRKKHETSNARSANSRGKSDDPLQQRPIVLSVADMGGHFGYGAEERSNELAFLLHHTA